MKPCMPALALVLLAFAKPGIGWSQSSASSPSKPANPYSGKSREKLQQIRNDAYDHRTQFNCTEGAPEGHKKECARLSKIIEQVDELYPDLDKLEHSKQGTPACTPEMSRILTKLEKDLKLRNEIIDRDRARVPSRAPDLLNLDSQALGALENQSRDWNLHVRLEVTDLKKRTIKLGIDEDKARKLKLKDLDVRSQDLETLTAERLQSIINDLDKIAHENDKILKARNEEFNTDDVPKIREEVPTLNASQSASYVKARDQLIGELLRASLSLMFVAHTRALETLKERAAELCRGGQGPVSIQSGSSASSR